MLLFNRILTQFFKGLFHFNTSNVTIQLAFSQIPLIPNSYFNTSNVTIQQQEKQLNSYADEHFNTSNVTIQPSIKIQSLSV